MAGARPTREVQELSVKFVEESPDGRLIWETTAQAPDAEKKTYVSTNRLLRELVCLGVLREVGASYSATAPFVVLESKLHSGEVERTIRLPTPISYTRDDTWAHPHSIAPYLPTPVKYQWWSLHDVDLRGEVRRDSEPCLYLYVCHGVKICVGGKWEKESSRRAWLCENGPILPVDPAKEWKL